MERVYRTPILTLDPNAQAGGGLVEVVTLADAQAAVEALREQLRLVNIDQANAEAQANDLQQREAEVQRERDALKLVNETHMKTVMKLSHVVEQNSAALDAEREKVKALEAAVTYYKQTSKNGGVYSVSGGHIGNLMDWCKDNLKHCKFSGTDEDNLDLDLVQTVQQIPQLKTQLSQLQALVRAFFSARASNDQEAYTRTYIDLKRTLDATIPAPGQKQVHSCEIPGCVSCANPAGGDDE